MFVTLQSSELSDYAVEFVLLYRMTFLLPFSYGDDRAALREHQTQESPS